MSTRGWLEEKLLPLQDNESYSSTRCTAQWNLRNVNPQLFRLSGHLCWKSWGNKTREPSGLPRHSGLSPSFPNSGSRWRQKHFFTLDISSQWLVDLMTQGSFMPSCHWDIRWHIQSKHCHRVQWRLALKYNIVLLNSKARVFCVCFGLTAELRRKSGLFLLPCPHRDGQGWDQASLICSCDGSVICKPLWTSTLPCHFNGYLSSILGWNLTSEQQTKRAYSRIFSDCTAIPGDSHLRYNGWKLTLLWTRGSVQVKLQVVKWSRSVVTLRRNHERNWRLCQQEGVSWQSGPIAPWRVTNSVARHMASPPNKPLYDRCVESLLPERDVLYFMTTSRIKIIAY